jgi:hypothetical protein
MCEDEARTLKYQLREIADMNVQSLQELKTQWELTENQIVDMEFDLIQ